MDTGLMELSSATGFRCVFALQLLLSLVTLQSSLKIILGASWLPLRGMERLELGKGHCGCLILTSACQMFSGASHKKLRQSSSASFVPSSATAVFCCGGFPPWSKMWFKKGSRHASVDCFVGFSPIFRKNLWIFLSQTLLCVYILIVGNFCDV